MRLDLATEWRSRRWRRLLNIIDHLPRHSAYVEAMANDEQLAEHLARQPEPKQDNQSRRRMSDWSPDVELLTSILNRLGELVQAVAVLGGAKPRKVPPAPHPVTAMDRARNRRRFEKHRSLAARVLSGRRPE